MTQKIIGLSCGRKHGNSEHFLKAALMAAEEEGVESQIIRAMDLKVLPCNSCWACLKSGRCAKDDVDWILEQTLLSDAAVIVSAPVYHLRSCSYLMIIAEKTNHLFSRKADIFERRRVGAAISVGGSGYDGWTSLGLTSINLFLQHFTTLVDQVQIDHCAAVGAALTPDNESAIERSRQLGKNVARALKLPFDQWKFMGDEPAVSCPVCHCNIVYVEKDFPEIMCPICEVHGIVSVNGDKFSVAWNSDDVREPRFSTPKERHHLEWITRHERHDEPLQIALPEVQEKIRRYNAYGEMIAPKKE
ncbi:MAG: flavodoxin family protein [Chloroflexi bacterium]|nr:flavodoxin family protein [Chloroflexota bacterium]MCL5734961.1 flavodoxin family protein [Actinomycetota bacterium]